MNITLINAKYSDVYGTIIFRLKTNYGNYEFTINKRLNPDWNWNDYNPLTAGEKAQIEAFIKQYLFDKLKEVVW